MSDKSTILFYILLNILYKYIEVLNDKNIKIGGGIMQNKNLVERMEAYVFENGNIVKNYKMMCEILDEKTTSGEAKQNQLNRWKVYFDYNKVGHKFEIVKIYDDETIEENEKEYFSKVETAKMFARSPYRKDLSAIILYILKTYSKDGYLTNKLNFAINCGMLNRRVKDKTKHKDYMSLRKTLQEKHIRRTYLSEGMYMHFYCLYSRTLKNSIYRIIEGTLDFLQEMKLIAYKTIFAGIKNGKLMPLTAEEIVKNKNLERQILDEIYLDYIKVASKFKEKIEIQDLMYYPKLLEKFYDVKEKRNKELGYNHISKYYDIYLEDDFEHPATIEVINNHKDFEKVSKRLNKTYVDRVLKRENKKIKRAKAESKDIETEYLIGEKDLDTWYYQKMIAYYNKIELLDQFVNCNEPVDVIIIDDEYSEIIDTDKGKSAAEILKELNIFSKKFEEEIIIISEKEFNNLVQEEAEG